ncbi:ABC transporter permease subunit, partial [Ruminococcaceae bacterium OttesenSCG-928-L11]|nr:ABC transporter permease subunit [Ruminococcaceae bacterium OttesenSCG-928-L11]
WSAVWQTTGWGSIIYVSALSSVSPDIHEAAIVDGATKLQRIWNIDLPSIMPTIITLLILNCGRIMSIGFEKVYLMQSAANLASSEIISTYTYKIGIQGGQYSYAAAIGLFNNAVNMVVLVVVNKISDKLTGAGLW